MHEAALFGKTDVVQILLAAGERLAALLSTQHARVGIISPRIPGGGLLLAAFEPNMCMSPLVDCKCTKFLYSWIKYLWMKTLVVLPGALGILEFDPL